MIEAVDGIWGARVLDSEKRLVLTSWQTLLERMDEVEADASIRSDIRQLRGLTRRQNEGTYRIPSGGAETPDFDARHAFYRRLIRSAVRQGRRDDWLVPEGLTWGNSPRYYSRRYVYVAKASPVWLGLGVEYRTNLFERTPIWVSIPHRFWPDAETEQDGMVKSRDFRRLPIYLKDDPVFDNVLNDLVTQFKAITDPFVAIKRSQTSGSDPA